MCFVVSVLFGNFQDFVLRRSKCLNLQIDEDVCLRLKEGRGFRVPTLAELTRHHPSRQTHLLQARLTTALSRAFPSQADSLSAHVLADHSPAKVLDLLCDTLRLEAVATDILQRLRAKGRSEPPPSAQSSSDLKSAVLRSLQQWRRTFWGISIPRKPPANRCTRQRSLLILQSLHKQISETWRNLA